MYYRRIDRIFLILIACTLLLCSCSGGRYTGSLPEYSPTPSAAPATDSAPTPTKSPQKSTAWSRAKDGEAIEISRNNITCTVNSASGLVTRVKSDVQCIEMDGIVVDVGYNESYAFSQLGYSSFEDKATWELPLVWPKMKSLPEYEFTGLTETEDGFIVSLRLDSLIVEYHYKMLDNALQLTVVIKSSRTDNQLINGVGFIIKGYKDLDKNATTAEFPGSTPQGIIALSKYTKYSAVSTDYACPIIQFHNGDRYINTLFVDLTLLFRISGPNWDIMFPMMV